MHSTQNNTMRQIAGLSSGTLASLTGLRRYDELDAVHTAFLHFAEKSTETNSTPFKNWQEAWRHFQAAAAPHNAGSAT